MQPAQIFALPITMKEKGKHTFIQTLNCWYFLIDLVKQARKSDSPRKINFSLVLKVKTKEKPTIENPASYRVTLE